MQTDKSQIYQTIQSQRGYFRSGVTLDIKWRKVQLRKLKDAIIRYQAEIETALAKDLGRSRVESYFCDIIPAIAEIDEMIRGLRKWSRPECHFSGLLCFPSIITKVYKMPYGTTLVISPYNFPILLTFSMMATCMCAGNTVVVKPSGKSSACTEILGKIISETFQPEYVAVIFGGHEESTFCLEQKFDKIFYTGSPTVGKLVLEKAAKNLTPVTLELGGETGNWCIIRKDADIKDAARKIAFFKSLNAGQICININQVAVAKEVSQEFINELKSEFISQLGSDAANSIEMPKLISLAAFEKCKNLAEKYRDRIVFGGHGNENDRKFEPTILYPIQIDDPIVQQELFNPLLPIVEYPDSQIQNILDTITVREHPLAMYIFTADKKWARKVMSTMQYGGGCINEVCVHLMVKGVPFNGVGHSGMGTYHGEWGFREFTHPQTVLMGSTRLNMPLRNHPYTGPAEKIKMAILKMLVK